MFTCSCAGAGLARRVDLAIGIPPRARSLADKAVLWRQTSWGAATQALSEWYLAHGVEYDLQLGLVDTNPAFAVPQRMEVGACSVVALLGVCA